MPDSFPNVPPIADHPVADPVVTHPARGRRRLRSTLLTVASLAVAGIAVAAGAAASAGAMPGESPSQTDTATFGVIEMGPDGAVNGYECTLSGDQLADLGIVTSEAVPAGELPDPPAGATGDGAVTPAQPLPPDAEVTDVVVEAVAPDAPTPDAWAPDASALPAAGSVRPGTAQECRDLLADVSGHDG